MYQFERCTNVFEMRHATWMRHQVEVADKVRQETNHLHKKKANQKSLCEIFRDPKCAFALICSLLIIAP